MPDLSPEDRAVVDFAYRETHLLNADRFAEWITLLTDDFEYRVPHPELRDDPRSSPYSATSLLSWESVHSLRVRFDRLASEFAWADRPPAFHRRHLTAVRVERRDDASWSVACDELVARSRTPEPPQLVSALREDLVRLVDGELRLARRTVFLDVDRPDLAQIALLF
ncbi:aromatic-ring-hydroxylating dioxygenase subunit beta [Nocardioides sp. LHD-245]|uniref:aromatic-ring-hydroxylating dioxygenase subunit beta n=1 Tax=Nocardioides sp. LHD-245 TaxID=3051387 RepID=UPI0027DFD973|nr:aromatic-ring-hydroxylating dioxygenase subunit beta [Nocardioides sp. LHD-245]